MKPFHPYRLLISGLMTCCFLGFTAPISAVVFHVSPDGSNTPPFDSYAKAAHEIADAFLAASGPGDTVFVYPGEYNVDTTISLPAGVVWGGAGRDEVVVNWSDPEFRPGRMIDAGGANVVYGIELNYPLTTQFSQDITGLHCHTDDSIIIYDCRFRELAVGVSGLGHCEVFDSEFYHGTGDGCRISYPTTRIHDNWFSGTSAGDAVVCFGASQVLIEDNRFDNRTYNGRPVAVYVHYATSSIHVRNNLMVKTAGVFWNQAPGVIENNTFTGGLNPRMTILLQPFQTLTIRNNVLYDMVPLFTFGRACYVCDTTGLITFVHNAYWPPTDSIYRIYPYDPPEMITLLDSANSFLYPMFIDDSLCLPQAGSPLIDAGDPAVLDADGSRSDIGWAGGPGGFTHDYEELPPLAPDSLWGGGAGGVMTLAWSPRPEADLAGYRLYRGTSAGFWTPGLEPVRECPAGEAVAVDTVPNPNGNVYYTVTSFDTAGLESGPSPEVVLVTTGIFDEENQIPISYNARIVRVYPNPFNSSTLIDVTIPASGQARQVVEIAIYDVLGRRVGRAHRGSLTPGRHLLPWAGGSDEGNPLASGVYFARLLVGERPFGSAVKLVILR